MKGAPLRQLVRRLASPQLALRLQHQELCLALSALGNFQPGTVVKTGYGSSIDRSVAAADSSPASVSDMHLLIGKAASNTAYASSLELGWIANSLRVTLCTGDQDTLAEALANRCLVLCNEREKIKLDTVAAVLKALYRASPLHAAHSATAAEIIRAVPKLFPQDQSKLPPSAYVEVLEGVSQIASIQAMSNVNPSSSGLFLTEAEVSEILGHVVDGFLKKIESVGDSAKKAALELQAAKALLPLSCYADGTIVNKLKLDVVKTFQSSPTADANSVVSASTLMFEYSQFMSGQEGGVFKLLGNVSATADSEKEAFERFALLLKPVLASGGVSSLCHLCDPELIVAIYATVMGNEHLTMFLLSSEVISEELLDSLPGVVAAALRHLPHGLRTTFAEKVLAKVPHGDVGMVEDEASEILAGETIESVLSALGELPKEGRWLWLLRLQCLMKQEGASAKSEQLLNVLKALEPMEAPAVVQQCVKHLLLDPELNASVITGCLRALSTNNLRHDATLFVCAQLHESLKCIASGAKPADAPLPALLQLVSSFPVLANKHKQPLLDRIAEDNAKNPATADGELALEELPAAVLSKAMRGEPIDDEDILQLAQSDVFSPDDLAKVVAALGYARKNPTPLVADLTAKTAQLSVASLVMLLTAMASAPRLRNSSALYVAICKRAAEHIKGSDEQVAELLVTFGALQPTRPVPTLASSSIKTRHTLQNSDAEQQFLEASCDKLAVNIAHTSTSDIANALLAIAHAETVPVGLLTIAGKHLTQRAPTMTIQEVTLVMKAFAQHDKTDEPLFDALLRRVHSKHLPTSAPTALHPNIDRDAVTPPSSEELAAFLVACNELDAPEFGTIHTIEAKRLADSGVEDLTATQIVAVLGAVPADMNITVVKCLKRLPEVVEEASSAVIGAAAAAVSRHMPPQDIAYPALKACSSRAAELIGIGTPVKGSDLAALLDAVAKYGTQDNVNTRISGSDAVDIQEWLTELVDTLNPTEMTSLITAMFKLDFSRRSLVHNAFVSFARNVELYTPKQISANTFHLGQLYKSPEEVQVEELEILVDHCVDHAEQFTDGPAIVKLLSGFSRLMLTTNRNPYVVFATRLRHRPVLHTLQKTDVTMAISAFGEAKFLDQNLFGALASRVTHLGHTFNAAEVTLTVSGYSSVHLLNDKLYTTMGQRVADIADDFTPTAANRVLGGFANINMANDDMCEKLMDSFMEKRPDELDGVAAAQMLHSMCRMDYMDGNHYAYLAESICKGAEQLTSKDIDAVCDVIRHTNWRADVLLHALGDQAVTLKAANQLEATTARNMLDTLGTFLVHHPSARLELSPMAKTVSKEVIADGEETGGHAAIGA